MVYIKLLLQFYIFQKTNYNIKSNGTQDEFLYFNDQNYSYLFLLQIDGRIEIDLDK